jgi:hypothetical protein
LILESETESCFPHSNSQKEEQSQELNFSVFLKPIETTGSINICMNNKGWKLRAYKTALRCCVNLSLWGDDDGKGILHIKYRVWIR